MSPAQLNRRALLAAGAAVASVAAISTHRHRAQAAPNDEEALRVSSLGHDPEDSTRFLQQAFDSDYATVIIDQVPGGWNTEPLFIRRSGLTVIVEPGVALQAKPGGFQGTNDRLLQIENCSDVTISGYGAMIKMNKADYRTGEWRNAMRLYGVENVLVEGLVLRDSGGDGIGMTGPNGRPSRNVVLRDLVCDNNKRNGLTIGNAANVLVEGCALINTSGTAPQSGVDFEPDHADQELTSIVLRNCFIHGNVTSGILLFNGPLRSHSAPVDVTVERTTVGRQAGGSPQVMVWGARDSAPGAFSMRDCLIHVEPNSGALGTLSMPDTGTMTQLDRVGIWSLGNPHYYYEPIVFRSDGLPNYGNLDVKDTVLVTDQRPLVVARRDPDGTNTLTNVTGKLTVVNPNGAEVDFGEVTENVTLTVTQQDVLSSTEVSVMALGSSLRGGEVGRVRFTRLSSDTSLPLTLAYTTAGTARERYDYAGQGRVAVIPAGKRDVVIEIPTYARRTTSDPEVRELVVALASGPGYTSPAGRAANITIRG